MIVHVYAVFMSHDIYVKREKGLEDIQSSIFDTTERAIQFGTDTENLRDNLVSLIDGGICNSVDPTLDSIDEIAAEVVSVLIKFQDFSKGSMVELQ